MNLSLRTWVPVLGFLAGSALVTGCVAEEGVAVRGGGAPGVAVEVAAEPPPPQAEAIPVQRPGYVWVRGHWQWMGGRYAWVPGHAEAVRVGRAWIEGHWERRPRGWVWVEGYWR